LFWDKKKLEGVANFNNIDIKVAIVELDCQLLQVPAIKDPKLLEQVIGHIRDELHQLFYLVCGNGLDIREFVSHNPGDRTPLN